MELSELDKWFWVAVLLLAAVLIFFFRSNFG
jgi:hypothetical protein